MKENPMEGENIQKRIDLKSVTEKPPITPEDQELLKKQTAKFMSGVFEEWVIPSTGQNKFKLALELKDPASRSNEDWKTLATECKPEEIGAYTLNPEAQGINFEKAKVQVVKLPDAMNGKPLPEVIEYIVATYSKDYIIPGIEYWQWCIEHPDTNPGNMEAGKWYFFPGSLLRGMAGVWRVPAMGRGATSWGRKDTMSLKRVWYPSERVILLTKDSERLSPAAETKVFQTVELQEESLSRKFLAEARSAWERKAFSLVGDLAFHECARLNGVWENDDEPDYGDHDTQMFTQGEIREVIGETKKESFEDFLTALNKLDIFQKVD